MPSRRLAVPAVVAVTALIAIALAPGAAPLAAYVGVETFHGSHCHPSHFNGETEDWVYEGANLVNRGSGTWDVLIASCPVNAKPTKPVASSRLYEIRVVVDGAAFSTGWCNVIDWQGVERYMRVSSTNPEWFWWTPPANSGVHSRDFTVRCLLLPDWKLERVEVVWSW